MSLITVDDMNGWMGDRIGVIGKYNFLDEIDNGEGIRGVCTVH